MRIRWVWLALALAGCGNDGAQVVDGAASEDSLGDAVVDMAVDAPSPRRPRGTVGAARRPFPDSRLQLLAGFVRVTDGAPGCQGFTPNSAANRLRRGNSLPGTANIIVARMSPTRDGHLACAA